MKKNIITVIMAATILIAGCGKKSPSSSRTTEDQLGTKVTLTQPYPLSYAGDESNSEQVAERNANFEGVFSADPMTGVIDWVDGGHGDNYSIAVTGDVLYTVGHPHDWGMLDWNPQYPDPWQFQRTAAINKHRSPTLTDTVGTSANWQAFAGRPAAQPLHWLPDADGRHVHRSGPSGMERRDQR